MKIIEKDNNKSYKHFKRIFSLSNDNFIQTYNHVFSKNENDEYNFITVQDYGCLEWNGGFSQVRNGRIGYPQVSVKQLVENYDQLTTRGHRKKIYQEAIINNTKPYRVLVHQLSYFQSVVNNYYGYMKEIDNTIIIEQNIDDDYTSYIEIIKLCENLNDDDDINNKNLIISHLCHNSMCINDHHLALEPQAYNLSRINCPGTIKILYKCSHCNNEEEIIAYQCPHNPKCIFAHNDTNPAWIFHKKKLI